MVGGQFTLSIQLIIPNYFILSQVWRPISIWIIPYPKIHCGWGANNRCFDYVGNDVCKKQRPKETDRVLIWSQRTFGRTKSYCAVETMNVFNTLFNTTLIPFNGCIYKLVFFLSGLFPSAANWHRKCLLLRYAKTVVGGFLDFWFPYLCPLWC